MIRVSHEYYAMQGTLEIIMKVGLAVKLNHEEKKPPENSYKRASQEEPCGKDWRITNAMNNRQEF
jgi:hypothetical protein